MVFASKDGANQQLDAKNGWGSALQAGLNVPLSQRFGLFVDVKKVFVKTTATGFLPAAGGAPVRAETTPNPRLAPSRSPEGDVAISLRTVLRLTVSPASTRAWRMTSHVWPSA